jgi:hypothetical protein
MVRVQSFTAARLARVLTPKATEISTKGEKTAKTLRFYAFLLV